jgi:hypothetical protein
MPSPFFSVVFVRCHFVSVLVRWLGGSFAVSFAVSWMAMCAWKNCKCATKSAGISILIVSQIPLVLLS